MRVLVTGATGFVGYHAARELVASGHEVRALVRDPGKAARVLGPLGLSGQDFVRGDMTDVAAVDGAIAGCGAVLHSAASVGVTDGGQGVGANANGARVVVGAAAKRGLPCVYISSLQALMKPGRPVTEATLPHLGKTAYSRSKAEADLWVRERLEDGAPISIVYPSGVVGPDDPGLSESVKAYRGFLRGTLRVGAMQMVDARDLARLLVALVASKHRGPILAAGHYFTFDTLTEALEEVTGATVPRIGAPAWALQVAGRVLDLVGAATGRTMPLTAEGVAILTGWERVPDSEAVQALGVEWRPSEETLRDLFRWLVEAGRLPANAVPALAVESTTNPSDEARA